MSVRPSTRPCIRPSIRPPFMHPSVLPPVRPSSWSSCIRPSARPSKHSSVHPSKYSSVHPSFRLVYIKFDSCRPVCLKQNRLHGRLFGLYGVYGLCGRQRINDKKSGRESSAARSFNREIDWPAKLCYKANESTNPLPLQRMNKSSIH